MSGLSGLSLFVPKARVRLADWCAWTGASAEKIHAVVGDAFRVAAHHEDVYTLAANAALRLIGGYDVDPARVGLLVLATESSTDNAVGGPTLKGLIDMGLVARGLPATSRSLETYEVKQACLSGLNGLLAALRFVACEPDRVAIVVAADIAEYARGSSGEPTQGAGAVAMLVEAEPRLLAIDPARVGRSAADRVLDFRKPVRSATTPEQGWGAVRPPDFPTFSGHYSTHCYLDAVDHAFTHLLARRGESAAALLERMALVLLHRPYEKMPVSSLHRMALRALDDGQLAAAARAADVRVEEVRRELAGSPDLAALVLAEGPEVEPTPALTRLLKVFGRTPEAHAFVEAHASLGRAVTRQLGNLYTASLPAWLGAALEEAGRSGRELAGREVLLVGYGSGDAALAVPARVVEGWPGAASRLGFEAALAGAVDLDRGTYERAHDRAEALEVAASGEVVLARVGQGERPGLDDRGIPHYAYR